MTDFLFLITMATYRGPIIVCKTIIIAKKHFRFVKVISCYICELILKHTALKGSACKHKLTNQLLGNGNVFGRGAVPTKISALPELQLQLFYSPFKLYCDSKFLYPTLCLFYKTRTTTTFVSSVYYTLSITYLLLYSCKYTGCYTEEKYIKYSRQKKI